MTLLLAMMILVAFATVLVVAVIVIARDPNRDSRAGQRKIDQENAPINNVYIVLPKEQHLTVTHRGTVTHKHTHTHRLEKREPEYEYLTERPIRGRIEQRTPRQLTAEDWE